jgi:heme-degrading monooxygenase HmoA
VPLPAGCTCLVVGTHPKRREHPEDEVLERQKGHRFHHLLESVDVPGEGVSVSAWDSREDAEAYERSGVYEELVAKFGHFYTGPERLASYEVRE